MSQSSTGWKILCALVASLALLATLAPLASATPPPATVDPVDESPAEAPATTDPVAAPTAPSVPPASAAPTPITPAVDPPPPSGALTPRAGACTNTPTIDVPIQCTLNSMGDVAHFNFSAAADSTLLIRVAQLDLSFLPTWTLTDQSGDIICSPTFDRLTLCHPDETGNHLLTVTNVPAAPGPAGDYILGIWNGDPVTNCPDSSTISFGQPADAASISEPGELDCVGLPLVTGDRVRIHVDDLPDPDVVTPEWKILGNGLELCNNLFAGSKVVDCDLTGPGPFELVIWGAQDLTTDYEVRVTRLNNPIGCTAAAEQSFDTTLANSGTISTLREQDCFTFDGDDLGTELIRLLPDPADKQSAWSVLAGDGTQVCGDTVTSFPGSCDLAGPGTYTLVVHHYDIFTGPFGVGVYDLENPTGCDPVSVSFAAPPTISDISAVGEVDCYEIPATAGDQFRIRVTSVTDPHLLGASLWDSAGNVVCIGGDGRVDLVQGCTPTVSGPMHLIVSGYQDDVPDYEVRVVRYNDPQGCNALPTDSFDTTALAGDLTLPREVDCFTFDDADGAGSMLMGMLDGAGDATATWGLFKPDGTSDCNGSPDNLVTCPITTIGQHAVVVTDFLDAYRTGGYLLSVVDPLSAGCNTFATTDFGTPFETGSISVPGQLDCWEMDAPPDGVVRFRTRAETPAGFVVVNGNGIKFCESQTAPTRNVDCHLTGPGPYREIVYAFGDTTLDYGAAAHELTPAGGCASLPPQTFGTPPAGAGSLDVPGEQDCFTFTATAGFKVLTRVNAVTGTFSAAQQIIAPSGDLMCTETGEQLPTLCTLDEDGTYTLIISTNEITATGTYAVGVYDPAGTSGCEPVPSTSFGAPPDAGTIPTIGEIDCHQLPAVDGDQFRIRVYTDDPAEFAGARVVDSAGVQLCSFGAGSDLVLDCNLAGTPPFKLHVWGHLAHTPDYHFQARRLNNPGGCTLVPSPALTFGPVNSAIGSEFESDCVRFDGASGDQIQLSTAPGTLSDLMYMRIYGPNGGLICSDHSTVTCTLTETGQHAVVLTPQLSSSTGTYQLSGTCQNPACGTVTYSVQSLSPATVGQGFVTVAVHGKVLTLDDTVEASLGGTTIVGEPIQVSPDQRVLWVRFDFTGAPLGVYDIATVSTLGDPGALLGALTVEEAERAEIDAALLTRPFYIPNRPITYELSLSNPANVDGVVVPVVIGGFPAGMSFQFLPTLYEWNESTAESTPVPYDHEHMYYEANGKGYLVLFLNRVSAGSSLKLSFRTNHTSFTDYHLTVQTGECFDGTFTDGVGLCVRQMVDSAFAAADTAHGIESTIGTTAWAECIADGQEISDAIVEHIAADGSVGRPLSPTGIVSHALGAPCVASLLTGDEGADLAIDALEDLVGDAAVQWPEGLSCFDPTFGIDILIRAVGSIDPNEIQGPLGVGEDRFVRGDEPFTYTIYFENLASASAPAQEVFVTDQLDPAKFDLSTLTFGAVQFGDTVFEPTSGSTELDELLDLRPAQELQVHLTASVDEAGLVSFALQSKDPVTGELPEDPFSGFLPPNTDGEEGQGHVTFTVMPKDPADGAVLTNGASIVFDVNAPIVTNIWSNTIDIEAPTSAIEALPATTPGTMVELAIDSTDDGSGIAVHQILVTDNGGSVHTAGFTAGDTFEFTGEIGHTYAFSSIARDAAGNVEAAPAGPDATTELVPPTNAPGPPTDVTGTAGDSEVDVSWTAPTDIGGTPLTGYTATAAPGGATCAVAPPTTTCTVAGLTNGTAYTFTVVATNAVGDSPPSDPSDPVTPLAPTECGPALPGPFPDVAGNHPFCVDIEWLASNEITGGFPDGTFRPGADITRQAMAAFLYRYAGEPPFTPPGTPTFSDVPTDHPFFTEIEWLADSGITGGFPDGTFRPAGQITRQSTAAFFYRLAGEPAFTPPGTQTFPDVGTGHPFYLEIEWLSSTGITGGFADGTFRPGSPVTRQAFAAFLHRYDELDL